MVTETQLKKFYDVVAACNRCGFCTSYCPTYLATGRESHSPRGRNQAFRAMIEGRFSNPSQAHEILDTCLLCGECTSVCFSEVPTADLMVQARAFLNQKEGIPSGLRFFLGKILIRPKLFRRLLKIAFWGKRLGVSRLLVKTGLLQKFSPPLAAAEPLLENVPYSFLSDQKESRNHLEETIGQRKKAVVVAQKKITDLKSKGKNIPAKIEIQAKANPTQPKLAYFPPCGSQYLRPETGLSTVKLLKMLKLDFMIPQTVCCGLPAASYGVVDEVESFAMKNIEKLESAGYEKIIADDTSCSAHLFAYPSYFADDAARRERAEKFVSKFISLPEFLIQSGLKESLKTKNWVGGPVAFHDPCKAQYGLRSVKAPRDLLLAVPHMKLVEIKDSDQCCGGGGTFSFVHPELSQEIMNAKIGRILESGAEIVTTTSASCLIQIAYGLRRRGSKIEVVHLSELLARVLQI